MIRPTAFMILFKRNGLIGYRCGDLELINGHLNGVPLSPQQGVVLSVILAREYATQKEILPYLWPNPDHEPISPGNSISRIVERINFKLQPLGISLRHVTGYRLGYSIRRD